MKNVANTTATTSEVRMSPKEVEKINATTAPVETEVQRLLREAKEANNALKAAKEKAKAAKDAAKAVRKESVSYTRLQAMGDVFKPMTIEQRRNAKVEDLVKQADALFLEKTGTSPNPKETLGKYHLAVQLMKVFDLI
jgi:hypothetical protein